MRPAFAQDILLEKDAPKSAREEIQEMLGGAKKEEKKPENIHQYANAHYKRCIQAQHHVLHGKSLEMMCGCVSAKIVKEMTLQQMAEISRNTDEGQMQLGRVLMFAYRPCLKDAVYSSLYGSCAYNPKYKHLIKNLGQTCRCIAESVSTKMHAYSEGHIQYIMRDRPEDFEPLSAILPLESYKRTYDHHNYICMRNYGQGSR